MTFDDLFHSFASTGLLVGPSELQGMFCGRLVMGEVLGESDLLQYSAEYVDSENVEEISGELVSLYQQCLEQIHHPGFELQLILPEDDVPIGQRTQALANWCQGFLYGLGRAGLHQGAELSEDAVETLEDISAISQLHFEDADSEDEMNFFELVEFVRVVVLVLYAELDQSEDEQKQKQKPTLH